MQELQRKPNETGQQWYERLNALSVALYEAKLEAKKVSSVEVNLAEMKRRAKRDDVPVELVVGRSNLNADAMKAVLVAAKAEEGAK